MATRFLLASSRSVLAPFARSRPSGFGVPTTRTQTEFEATTSRCIAAMATLESVTSAPYEPTSLPSVSASDVATADWTGDLLAVAVFEDALETKDEVTTITDSSLQSLDSGVLNGIIAEMLEGGEFKGKKGSSATLRLGGGARYVSVIGLGLQADAAKAVTWGASTYQAAGAALATACKTSKAKTAALCVCGGAASDQALALEGLTYGVLTGAYTTTRFKAAAKPSVLESVSVLGMDASGADASIARGSALARGNLYTRFLVEAPPNVCTPTYLANSAVAIADQFPDVMSCEILEKAACEEMGMGCYLGVAECSDHPPKFIHLTYKSGTGAKKVAIVGKGLTFDSGGYNIKAGAGSMIEMMKFDMGGAGAVFGAARAVAELRPDNIEVHFISASCENMIDGKGMRPGDILVSASGKTIEVGNTDAEGRLTLCDALWYAQEKVGATKCVDIATLTGAQIVALGVGMGAVMSPQDDMAAAISASGCKTGGEKWWRLPLEESYQVNLDSKIADCNNIAGRGAGTITAGLFLKQFVDAEKMEWAHLDIAGPCWDDKLGGATGFGATTLAAWVEKEAASE